MAAIYSAYKAMIEIEKELGRKNSNAEELEKTAEKIKEYCKEYLCNKEEKTLKRSTKDNICDISTLGATIPFNMFDIKEKQVINTIEKMNMTLRTYTNGYLRFENDSYISETFQFRYNRGALSDISDLVNEATFCTEDIFHRISGAQITAECNIPSVKVIIEDSELSSK